MKNKDITISKKQDETEDKNYRNKMHKVMKTSKK